MRLRLENTHNWRFTFDFIQFVSPFFVWLFSWGLIDQIVGGKIGSWGLAIFPFSLYAHAKWLHAFYDQSSAFCFVRLTLKVPISFSETKAIVRFTENNFYPEPFMYIASLPVTERKNEFLKKL